MAQCFPIEPRYTLDGVPVADMFRGGAANRVAYFLLAAGILLFSGSLYTMAITNVRWLGAITPLGGLCFLAGWAWLVIAPRL